MVETEYKSKTSPIFPEPRDLGKRPWGKEELLVLIPGKFMLKKIDHRSWFEKADFNTTD